CTVYLVPPTSRVRVGPSPRPRPRVSRRRRAARPRRAERPSAPAGTGRPPATPRPRRRWPPRQTRSARSWVSSLGRHGRQLVQVAFQVRVPIVPVGRAVGRVLRVEAVGLLPVVRDAV